MPVPQETEIRRPLLESVRGESPQNFSVNDFLRIIAKHFGEDINEMSSIDKNTFKSRIKEARSYLKRHKLLSNPSLQAYMLTKTGLDVLDNTTGIIDDECLNNLSAARSQLEPASLLPEISEPENTETAIAATEPELPDELDMTSSDDASDISYGEEATPEINDIISETEEMLSAEGNMLDEDITSEPEEAPEAEDITLNEEKPEPEDIMIESEEDYSDDTNGDEIMPDEELTQDYEELTQDYPDAAVIQSQSIEDVLARYNSELADRVLMRTASLSSDTFEVLVIDLLSKMGYRAFQNARYTNSSTDNGMIHGVILDIQGNVPIYIHAQKLSPGRTVGRSDIQDFVEALSDKGGKGIFATTAEFSDNATVYAQDERIMLIDGAKLAGLMIAHNFCVNVERVFEVKEIDEDSFNDYES